MPHGAYATSKGFIQLTDINSGEGFWVNASSDSTVKISGTPVYGILPLTTGWNLVGLKSFQPLTVTELIADNPQIISIWKWVVRQA